MKLLVTGAAGMLGHKVVAAGLAAGHDVVGADLAECDLTDPDATTAFVADMTATGVSRSQGVPGRASPSQRSTTRRPSLYAANAAPPGRSAAPANASATASKPASAKPFGVEVEMVSPVMEILLSIRIRPRPGGRGGVSM